MLSDIECGNEVGRRYNLLWPVSGDCVSMYLRFSLYFFNFLLSCVTLFQLSEVLNDLHLNLLPSSGGFEKGIESEIPLQCFVSDLFSYS
jgi:hypothetical protein